MSLLSLSFDRNMQSLSVRSDIKIAVAVSGGVDSLALLLLTRHWISQGQGQVIALTVNHNLRPEALSEAIHVQSICTKYDIEHHILTWEHDQIKGNLLEQARLARYKLMTDWCNRNDVSSILTAHHADDQIENFFIRLSKASGIFGLSNHHVNVMNNITILRPLFGIYKTELKKYVKDNNIPWCEDPSNKDPKYLRSNIRNWLCQMPQMLQKQSILQSIGYLSQVAEYIQEDFIALLESSTTIHLEGYAIYNIRHKPHALLHHMVLSHLLTTISGGFKRPRSEPIVRMLENVEQGKVVLHGCAVECDNEILTIYREFGRKRPMPAPLSTEVKWDGRWRSSCSIQSLLVDYLKQEEYRALKTDSCVARLLESVPQKILFTIPVIRRLEKLIAIPHIDYYNDENLRHITFSFEPQYISRLTHFIRT
jgi:tRNA(Ile)-lysidine synthase